MAVTTITAVVKIVPLGAGLKNPLYPIAIWKMRASATGDGTGGAITLQFQPRDEVKASHLWSWEWLNQSLSGNFDPRWQWIDGDPDSWTWDWFTTGQITNDPSTTNYFSRLESAPAPWRAMRGFLATPSGANTFRWTGAITNGAGRTFVAMIGGYLWDRKAIAADFPRWPY